MRNSRYVSAYARALIYAGLGETNEVFRQLNVAYDERCRGLVFVTVLQGVQFVRLVDDSGDCSTPPHP
jgi:hypothetical protein